MCTNCTRTYSVQCTRPPVLFKTFFQTDTFLILSQDSGRIQKGNFSQSVFSGMVFLFFSPSVNILFHSWIRHIMLPFHVFHCLMVSDYIFVCECVMHHLLCNMQRCMQIPSSPQSSDVYNKCQSRSQYQKSTQSLGVTHISQIRQNKDWNKDEELGHSLQAFLFVFCSTWK